MLVTCPKCHTRKKARRYHACGPCWDNIPAAEMHLMYSMSRSTDKDKNGSLRRFFSGTGDRKRNVRQ